ncbi:MAG: zinc transport system permease protein [Candidatus Tokpelaia sp. JSC189]|nr:MAG: zinc transport system permease protein [Candidatus Tokpelaia sp. JSC189]
MLDNFFLRALIGCVGITLAAGPLGCIVVWQRMAYFGDTIAHSALLGVAVAFIFRINMTLSVFIVMFMLVVILLLLQRRQSLSSDSLLGILSHSSLAISLTILSFLPWVRQDLSVYLFGDILSISKLDLLFIWAGGITALLTLIRLWQPLIAATISTDLAQAEGLSPERAKIAFMLLLALIIAIAMKIVGILLITALLILPAATARRLSKTPEQMAVLSAVLGALSAISGLYLSAIADTPSGPSVVVAGFVMFLVSLLPFSQIKKIGQMIKS